MQLLGSRCPSGEGVLPTWKRGEGGEGSTKSTPAGERRQARHVGDTEWAEGWPGEKPPVSGYLGGLVSIAVTGLPAAPFLGQWAFKC